MSRAKRKRVNAMHRKQRVRGVRCLFDGMARTLPTILNRMVYERVQKILAEKDTQPDV